MPHVDDYDNLSGQELRERLALAETVTILLGWEASRSGPGGEALTQAWMDWAHSVDEDFTSPRRHPDLNERRVHELIRERRATQERTLKIIGKDHPEFPYA